jgi:hypothetical protein
MQRTSAANFVATNGLERAIIFHDEMVEFANRAAYTPLTLHTEFGLI